MEFTTQLTRDLAGLLANAGAGVWRPDGTPYAEGERGVVLGAPGPTPVSGVWLATYTNDGGDHATTADSEVALQVRVRSPDRDPGPANDLADLVFDALQGLWGHTLPSGIRIRWAKRRNALPMGLDENDRYERADNYDLNVHRPGTHRE